MPKSACEIDFLKIDESHPPPATPGGRMVRYCSPPFSLIISRSFIKYHSYPIELDKNYDCMASQSSIGTSFPRGSGFVIPKKIQSIQEAFLLFFFFFFFVGHAREQSVKWVASLTWIDW